MTERRHPPTEDGRRADDSRLGQLVKIAAIAGALVGAMGFTVKAVDAVALGASTATELRAVTARTTRLEQSADALSYMTCVTFAETHAALQTPAYCDVYTRRAK